MDSTLTTIVGIFLRIGIPAVITIAAGWMLYRLDVRWQEETRKEAAVQGKPVMAANFGCWDIKGCTEAGKKKCPAYIHKDEMPCWQVFRSTNGELKESCLNCKVLKQAPVPVRA